MNEMTEYTYQDLLQRIEEAQGDKRKLQIIRDVLTEYREDDPKVKELIYKLR